MSAPLVILLWLGPPPTAVVQVPDTAPPAAPTGPAARALELPSAHARVQWALGRLPRDPDIGAVQRAAARRAELDPRATRRWIHRARAAAVLPTVTLESETQTGLAWGLDQEAGTADALQRDLEGGRGFRVRAGWELDRLVFNLDELRAARAVLDFVDWRERVLVQVTQLYFERRRLMLEALLEPHADIARAIARQVRVAELEALLEGLTGLRFSPARPRGALLP